MSVNLIIKMVKPAAEVPMTTELTATIAELKEQIAATAGLAKDNIRLVCAGKIWQDVATLGSYEPRDGAIVHCLNNPVRAVPSTAEQTLTEVDPMQSLMGAAPMQPAAPTGDPFADMMAQSQQMMQQNPGMMQEMMNSPMMQQMMSDPQMMRSIMSMNPQLNQLMESRPEIARMLDDPEVLQQSMAMIRNPSLMREMQRTQDQAIGRLDVMPGGHAALAAAHTDMVDPLMAALTGSADGTQAPVDLEAYAQQSQGPVNTQPLANPWGAPAPAPTPAVAPAFAASPTPFAGGFPAFGAAPQTPAAAPQGNPMAAMMQQMMSNPAMMQQSMQMMNNPAMMNMFGGQQGAGAGAPNPAMMNMFGGQQGAGVGTPSAAPPTTPAADPMAAMMQNMMSNPAMMQNMMQMMGNQNGGAGFPAMNGGAGFPAMNGYGDAGMQAPMAPMSEDVARTHFATQLAQLSAMGFVEEAPALRALQLHQGRVDAAIDTLLSNGGQ